MYHKYKHKQCAIQLSRTLTRLLEGRELRPDTDHEMVPVGLSVAHSRTAVPPSDRVSDMGEATRRGGEEREAVGRGDIQFRNIM